MIGPAALGEGSILGSADHKDAVVWVATEGLAMNLDQGGEDRAQPALGEAHLTGQGRGSDPARWPWWKARRQVHRCASGAVRGRRVGRFFTLAICATKVKEGQGVGLPPVSA